MQLEQAFSIGKPRCEIVRTLDNDRILAEIFPGTRVTRKDTRVRETRTPFQALGQSRELRLVFQTLEDGNLRFSKICDGNVWRSLEGEIRLEAKDTNTTRVLVRMEGRTRSWVPEFTLRRPLQAQIEQMAQALHSVLKST